ncbi:MAG: DUF1552 domain-containing protein, partial [Verrucomicrobiota bacterium]
MMRSADSSTSRRRFLRGASGAFLTLPLLESTLLAAEVAKPPMRMVATGVFYGFIPEYFFPKTYGRDYQMPRLLKSLEPHRQDLSIFSGLDHNIAGGHDYTKYFLSGIPVNHANGYEESNISV